MIPIGRSQCNKTLNIDAVGERLLQFLFACRRQRQINLYPFTAPCIYGNSSGLIHTDHICLQFSRSLRHITDAVLYHHILRQCGHIYLISNVLLCKGMELKIKIKTALCILTQLALGQIAVSICQINLGLRRLIQLHQTGALFSGGERRIL